MAVLQRPDEILRCVHQLHHIAAVIPALAIYRGNEHLERRVARARAHSGQAGVDADRAFLRGDDRIGDAQREIVRSEEHTSELQSLMRISYAVFCLQKKKETKQINTGYTESSITNYIGE